MQLQNNTICYTQNNNAIIVYSVNNFEIVTTNYIDNEILVTIYDENCDCIAVCIFESIAMHYNYKTLVNNTTNAQLDALMQEINNTISKTNLK